MKREICTMAGLMLTLSMAGQARAQEDLYGSDTLFDMTQYLLEEYGTTCGGGTITYLGQGSGKGETEMQAGNQDIAPMSRALKTSFCPGYEATAQAMAHSLDGISMYRNGNNLAEGDDQCQTYAPNEKSCESITCEPDRIGWPAIAGVSPKYPMSSPNWPYEAAAAPATWNGRVSWLNIKDVNGVAGLAGTDCPGCVDEDADGNTDEYLPSDWKDALAVLYFGSHHDAAKTVNCNSDVRWALAGMASVVAGTPVSGTAGLEPLPLDCENDCWENSFMKDKAPFVDCTDEKCNFINHLYRRGDKSGTTDTFKTLLGVAGTTSFCNGTEYQDNDPIRRPVHPREDVGGQLSASALRYSPSADECAPAASTVLTSTTIRTLGLVLPIVVPSDEAYLGGKNPNVCVSGGGHNWRGVSVTLAPKCDDDAPSIFGLCLVPRDENGESGCINVAGNPAMFTPANADTRTTNKVQRDLDGTIVRDENNLEIVNAYYNLQAYQSVSTYASPCNENNSTDQIACLAVSNPCSMGFAGMGAKEQVPAVHQLEICGVDADATTIRNASYKMSRKLYLNSLVGRAASTAAQQKLFDCFNDRPTVDDAASFAGFVTLDDSPAGKTVPIEDPCP